MLFVELPHVSPESVGIPSSAVMEFLDRLYAYGIEMHSFMLLRHGKVCAQGWWHPYAPETPHIMFSFSKSLTSTAIGFAVQEGILSLDDKLVDLFPDKIPENPSENLKKAAVRHLLMMGCGHETEIPNLGIGDPDWIKSFLHHPFVFEPGTKFMYNTAGTNLLAAILKRKSGQHVTEFLKPRLFEPLGMTDIFCQPLPDGTQMGGAGMYLTTEDMARFVQFVANEGMWEGKQLLNKEWFAMATSKQIENKGVGWGGDPDWQQGYGFQFWRCEPDGVFRGDGAFGQYGIVMKKQDAVLVITSASLRLQAVLTAVWDTLLPKMSADPLPEDTHGWARLRSRLQNLELCTMLSLRNPGAEGSLEKAVYAPVSVCPSIQDLIGGVGKYTPDGGNLQHLSFSFSEEQALLTCKQTNGDISISIGMQGHFVITDVNGVPYGAVGRWRANNKLEVEVRNMKMAGGKRFLFLLSGDTMVLSGDSTIPEAGGLSGPVMEDVSFKLETGSVSTRTKMYWEQN